MDWWHRKARRCIKATSEIWTINYCQIVTTLPSEWKSCTMSSTALIHSQKGKRQPHIPCAHHPFWASAVHPLPCIALAFLQLYDELIQLAKLAKKDITKGEKKEVRGREGEEFGWMFLVAVSHEISSAALCSCTMNVKLRETVWADVTAHHCNYEEDVLLFPSWPHILQYFPCYSPAVCLNPQQVNSAC